MRGMTSDVVIVLGVVLKGLPWCVSTAHGRCPGQHNILGQFRYPAVQRYVHDLAEEMGTHIDSITSTLVMFVEIGPSPF